MDWKHLLAYITGTVDQELQLRNEYLDVHFISSSSVESEPACRGAGDIKHVQNSGAVD